MLRIFRFILTGDWHLHSWEIIDKRYTSVIDTGERFTSYHCRCIHCGTIKVFDAK